MWDFDNGERLVELCATYDLLIGGTLFPHRDIHKLTWCSPNGRDKNQIEHLMINGRWRRSLLVVKVRREADVGSDHHLVTARVIMKLRKTGHKPLVSRQFNTVRLQDPTAKNSFILQLKNRFQAVADITEYKETDGDTISARWETIKTVYQKSCETCLGYKKDRRRKSG